MNLNEERLTEALQGMVDAYAPAPRGKPHMPEPGLREDWAFMAYLDANAQRQEDAVEAAVAALELQKPHPNLLVRAWRRVDGWGVAMCLIGVAAGRLMHLSGWSWLQ